MKGKIPLERSFLIKKERKFRTEPDINFVTVNCFRLNCNSSMIFKVLVILNCPNVSKIRFFFI